MCLTLGVSRVAYYDWLKRPISKKEIADSGYSEKIQQVFDDQRQACGTRTIKKALADDDLRVSRRRIARLMNIAGLVCKTTKKFKATTNSNHDNPVADNILSRHFDASGPNQKWVGDITYIRTREGWLYLATVIDLYSRKVVGFSMSERMTSDLVNQALLSAIGQRKPNKGLIWHTDRGSQYASSSHRR